MKRTRKGAKVSYPFADVITSEDELRAMIGVPSELSLRKEITRLDHHCRLLISRAPFLLVSSSGRDGRCDVSPRGDAPGFVRVLNETMLLIPDRSGNRRADTLINVLENPYVGLLFLIPTMEETLRVNGRATLVRDADLMATMVFRGKTPELAIAVEVELAFLQCAKALKRSHLWEPSTWLERSELPTLAQMLIDQAKPDGVTVDEMACALDEAYRTKLY
jgi:PPOX class probable FMN-dependent enzyme